MAVVTEQQICEGGLTHEWRLVRKTLNLLPGLFPKTSGIAVHQQSPEIPGGA